MIQFNLKTIFLLTAIVAVLTDLVVSEISRKQAWQRVSDIDGLVLAAMQMVSRDVEQRYDIPRQRLVQRFARGPAKIGISDFR